MPPSETTTDFFSPRKDSDGTATMRVLSVNIGKVRETKWKGKTFATAIFKEPVSGKLQVTAGGLMGDEQANTANHGGKFKALLAYAHEHYLEFWRDSLPGMPLPHGSFGENLTTDNWLDDRAHLGDTYRIGTAVVMVTIPRKPCYKLNARLGRDDILPMYLESKRTGFYLSVVNEGEIGAGDQIELLERHPLGVTPRNVVDLYLGHSRDRELLERALKLEFATDRMRETLTERFGRYSSHSDQEAKEF